MDGATTERCFPIQDVPGVVQLFKDELEKREPDLALLSIVVGSIENMITCGRTPITSGEDTFYGNPKLPKIEYKIIQTLYSKFHSTITGYVDTSQYVGMKYASRELVKKVSDVVWNSLTRSYYKDRAHLQSLYSYLTGNKLDCFGVAFAVVAGCQVLGFNDVHLALSEDHAWVVFGKDSKETAEVTWHGKGLEDKRGQPVDAGIASRCWLYLCGHPVVCDRQTEVAAIVSAINPSLTVNNDSAEVAMLQQELLWLLYDMGKLSGYPMAIGNLGDLEEINPTAGRPPCSTLFQESILSARMNYKNMHVYPYTYQGGYFYRQHMYKEAFESWANASDVLKQYNYTRDDEEIYKEVMEIANELIPHIMKVESSGHSARCILKDPECFAYLLRFYDGICQWEEGSQTPVLHIGWAKPLVNTISKFDALVRGHVVILGQDFIENGGDENCNLRLNGDKTKELKELGNRKNNVKENNNDEKSSEILRPDIKELTAACGERILNRNFLIQGGGEPFVGDPTDVATCSDQCVDDDVSDILKVSSSHPKVILNSEKMRGLKDLLLGEKLNTHAISLQLTAQSQVQVGGRKSVSDTTTNTTCTRSKRSRRE